MRILIVNYRYFISGGPEKYMFNIKKMLEDNGHEVIPFSIHSNKNVETEYSKYFVEPIGGRDTTYAAGELKHGTISLIEDDILVVGVLTQSELYEKTISNMLECKSRGAYLMGLTTFGRYDIEDTVDFTVYIPKTDPLFATSLAVIPLQLLGYYISVAKGLDVDKPRNLAKSVTVE